MVIDVDGTKCKSSSSSESCDNSEKRILLPEKICIPKSQCNTTIYKMDNTYCGLCRDMESPNNYRFIGGINCLDSSILSKEGVKVYLDISLFKNIYCYPACGTSGTAIKLSLNELKDYSHFVKWIDVTKDIE